MKLTVEEKRWHGCKYQVVHPYLDSWSLSQNNHTWNNISQWCYDIYGKPGDPFSNTTDRWYLNNSAYWFRDERDLSLFLMRWS